MLVFMMASLERQAHTSVYVVTVTVRCHLAAQGYCAVEMEFEMVELRNAEDEAGTETTEIQRWHRAAVIGTRGEAARVIEEGFQLQHFAPGTRVERRRLVADERRVHVVFQRGVVTAIAQAIGNRIRAHAVRTADHELL